MLVRNLCGQGRSRCKMLSAILISSCFACIQGNTSRVCVNVGVRHDCGEIQKISPCSSCVSQLCPPETRFCCVLKDLNIISRWSQIKIRCYGNSRVLQLLVLVCVRCTEKSLKKVTLSCSQEEMDSYEGETYNYCYHSLIGDYLDLNNYKAKQ